MTEPSASVPPGNAGALIARSACRLSGGAAQQSSPWLQRPPGAGLLMEQSRESDGAITLPELR